MVSNFQKKAAAMENHGNRPFSCYSQGVLEIVQSFYTFLSGAAPL